MARSLAVLAWRRARRHWGSACSNTSGIAVPGRMSWNCWNSSGSQLGSSNLAASTAASTVASSASRSRRSRLRL